jgi:hypothetical protein
MRWFMRFLKIYGLCYVAVFVVVSIYEGSVITPFDIPDIDRQPVPFLFALPPFILICCFIYREKITQKIKSIPYRYLIYAAIAVSLTTGYYFIFAERTYEDCILNNLRDVNNNFVAANIRSACAKKHDHPIPSNSYLYGN